MSNFDFVKVTLPALFENCSRAESYMHSDPRAACVYSRMAVEQIVAHIYALYQLRKPYADDLNAMMNDPAFKGRVGPDISAKLNLIRKAGNDAAHAKRVTDERARMAVTELFHVAIFVSYHFSTNPSAVPTERQFDEKLAARQQPMAADEAKQLVKYFKEQERARIAEIANRDALLIERDELLAKREARVAEQEAQLADKDAQLAALNAELEAARAQVEAARQAAPPDRHDYDEASTRQHLIDLYLAEAGWQLDQPQDREYPVTGMPTATGKGFVDYVLWGEDGRPLAVVEAKRTTHSAYEGQQQAKLYADRLEAQFGRRPVIFYSNGYQHYIWDDAAFGADGGYPAREIQGFYTRDELELMIQRRTSRQALADAPIDSQIAGRYYQTRAIRAIDEAFDGRERRALLVMATGSGKTRTVIALVKQLAQAGWVKRVLFLADRTALVNQAVRAFKAHLPEMATVNLLEDKATEGRVFVSTYPTILNMVNQVDEAGRRFGPGFFDLVIVDEAHRSIYQKYGAIFEWFDAPLVGLTATPKDEIDRNTYGLFGLEDGVPTDAYDLAEAVADGYLVAPKAIKLDTKFIREGIRYDELTEDDKDVWDALEWGDDVPDAVDSEELNRYLFNADTVDKVLATLMRDGLKVAGGDKLGKTIIFAKNQDHAEFIEQRFNAQYPALGGEFARVITHATRFNEVLIDSFSDPTKLPQIAISVDMLDTGIDVPDVVNLVIFKLIRSKTKFWQMIGRGTRLRPDLFGPGEDKSEFMVFDFCGNLEFFSQDLPEGQGSTQKSLGQRLFETRLDLVREFDKQQTEAQLRRENADWLREFVAGMNWDNVLVRPHRQAVERWREPQAWDSISEADAEQLNSLAGLPTANQDRDEQAKRFDLLVYRYQLAQLQGDVVDGERIREKVQLIAQALLTKDAIPAVAKELELLDAVAGDDWWTDVTLPMLDSMRRRLRGLVGFIEVTKRNPVYVDFGDDISAPEIVDLPAVRPGMNWERFQAKAQAYLLANQDHISLQRLRRNRPITQADLDEMTKMLVEAGEGAVDVSYVQQHVSGELGLFLRSLVGLDRAAVNEAFAEYLDETQFTAAQIRFIKVIIDELTRNGSMEPGRLFESPYTDNGRVDLMFADADLINIASILHGMTRTAIPVAAQ